MRGKLPRFIQKRRAEGLSYNEIAYEIRAEYGEKVTGTTVGNWIKKHDLNGHDA
jgi:hypothetical protein